MDDVNDSSMVATPRRIEVLTGTERRRRWSDEAKARIVAESLVAGAMVSKIARRHDVLPSQIYAWRKAVREGSLVLEESPPVFAAVEVMRPAPARANAERRDAIPMIEIEAGTVAVRINGGVDAALIERVIRVLKADA